MPLHLVLIAAVGCNEAPTPKAAPPELRGDAPALAPAPSVFRRLTYAQLVATLGDVLGEGLVLPEEIEPDTRSSGLYALGAGVTSFSSLGVERLESAAFDVAEQVLADSTRRAAVVPCEAVDVVDESCAATVVEGLGLRLWRRPLTAVERDRIAGIANTAASTLGSFDAGLAYAIAALLQSPHFIFRPELGEDDPDNPGTKRYTSYEMASRLSYFLWAGPPDAALLAAAAEGALVTAEGVRTEVDRMLVDPRARRGVRELFGDMLQLDALDSLTKDPLVYTYMSDGLAESAREQTLADIEALVFEGAEPFSAFLTQSETHLDRTLATLYDVPAPAREGFARATLPQSGGRRGFLGQASFLAVQSHATSTSVTKRGMFVREVLLCQTLPSPPAGLNTSIPEVSEDSPTMRDRVAQHLLDPSCASCHNIMDPIGLGFENFDGLARWRIQENDVTIDASGLLDGVGFSNAWELSGVIATHEQFPLCVNETVYQYATGRVVDSVEVPLVDWHAAGFKEQGQRLLWLMADIAVSDAFRKKGES